LAAILQQHAASPTGEPPTQQQQQQAAEQLTSVLFFSQCIQCLWSQLLLHLPSSSNLLTQLLPAAALPLAVLRTTPHPDASVLNHVAVALDLSSSSDALEEYERQRKSALHQAVDAAHALMWAHIHQRAAAEQQQQQQQHVVAQPTACMLLPPTAEGAASIEVQQQQQQQQQQPQQQQLEDVQEVQEAALLTATAAAWASRDVQLLQLAYLAVVVERLYADNQDCADCLASSVGRDRRWRKQLDGIKAVPPLHEQLFVELGMPVADPLREQQLQGWLVGVAIGKIATAISGMSAVADVADKQMQAASRLLESVSGAEMGIGSSSSCDGSSGDSNMGGGSSCRSSGGSSSSGVGRYSSSSSSSAHDGRGDLLAAEHAAALHLILELLLLHEGDDRNSAAMIVRLLPSLPGICVDHLLQQPPLLRQTLQLSLHLVMPFLQRTFTKAGGSSSAATAAQLVPRTAAEEAAEAAARVAELEALAPAVWHCYGAFLLQMMHLGEWTIHQE
jgi:uncharacterized membrane protein YgcG